ncbi:MAG: enoyl-CoA hydratase/isomerase family protein [Chloroflexota bacterium]
MGFSAIIYEKSGFVAKIILNRPEVRNALNIQMVTEINSALKQAKLDDEVRVVVITGADEAFCAGMDLKFASEATPQELDHFSEIWYADLTNILHGLGKPVIAAVNGLCMGGGCGLMSRCDMVIASEKARFGYGEIDVGANPAVHLTLLPRITNRLKAFEIIFTSKVLSAAEAERLGIVNRVAPHDKQEAEVSQLAQKLAGKSPVIIKSLRDAFYRAPGVEYKSSLADMGEIISATLYPLEDSKEGRRAFIEKRPPVWKGK